MKVFLLRVCAFIPEKQNRKRRINAGFPDIKSFLNLTNDALSYPATLYGLFLF